ncbi:phosphonate ABC transporter ATP-binding protein [bacterium]|nr:phosphonate ABC transporter ATP-binding protein [bacterium]
MDQFLQVQGLQKAYANGPTVLHDVSLTFKPGEFSVILGLSGAGKSTFLRCLNRLIEPTAGRIIIPRDLIAPEGKGELDLVRASSHELRLWRRKVGMIFQHFNLIKRLSVVDNVLAGSLGYAGMVPGALRLFSKSERDRALYNLERVGLLDHAYKRADALSGGQQQRVAIARALMQRPTVILADEPVASLDPKLAKQILDILKRVADEDGLTVMVSLHVLELARAYGDRMIGFHGGRVIFDGAPDKLDDKAVQQIYSRGTAQLQPV